MAEYSANRPERRTVKSYLQDGTLSPEAMERVFLIAEKFFHVAPWDATGGDNPFHLNAPGWGLSDATVVVIGASGESVGLPIFASSDYICRFTIWRWYFSTVQRPILSS